MFYSKSLFFQAYFLFFPVFAIGEPVEEKRSKNFNPFAPLEETGFLKKDTDYLKSSVFEGMDMIYSERFEALAPILSDYIKKVSLKLSEDFPISPYFQKKFVIFPSPRTQDSMASAWIFPFPTVSIYPSVSRDFMDRWSMFYWPQDAIVHEMTHIHQFAQNSRLDRFFHKLLGLSSYRNWMLPNFIKEGHAVFNESLYGFGGRLFSGWVRAFVLAQIPETVSLKRLLKAHTDSFSSLEKYLHGAYFFAYLHSQYGLEKIHRFFLESGRFAPLDFYGLSSALERVFGKSLGALFREYQQHYLPLAVRQKALSEKALISSQTDLPINSNAKQLYFLVSDEKSPPQLVVMDKKTEEITVRKTDLPLGKVFYTKEGRYVSVGRARTGASSLEFSLFGEGRKPLKKYNSQYVMDIYKGKTLSLNTQQSHKQNAMLLNHSFYDSAHSSAVMDHRGRVYYFKQNKSARTLYRDKKALFRFSSYSAYPVEADEEGLYFIASVPYGSGLFVYREGKGVFRLSKGDRITYARKIKKGRFLVSEIQPSEIQYKIIQSAGEIPELPFLYTYSFKKRNIFKAAKGSGKKSSFSKEQNRSITFKERDIFKAAKGSGKKSSFSKEQNREGNKARPSFPNRLAQNKDSRKSSVPGAQPYKPIAQDPKIGNLTRLALPDIQPYNPIASLRLTQIFLLPYPRLRLLYNSEIPKSFWPDRLETDLYFLSLFRFSDPMYFNKLDFQGFFGFKPCCQQSFKLRYSYEKYRPALSFFVGYTDGLVSRGHFARFQRLGFLGRRDVYKEKSGSLKPSLSQKDKSAGFAVKYPLFLKPYSDLSALSQVEFGYKKFYDRTNSKAFPLSRLSKTGKNYIRQEGGLEYKYKRKYLYAYSPHSQTNLKLGYNALYVASDKKKKSFLFIDGYAQLDLIRELSRELFLSWSAFGKRDLWNKARSRLSFKPKSAAIYEYRSFYRKLQYLSKMDFQLLKVFNHSHYFLQIPFSIRRWAPLAGLSLLSFRSEKEAFLLIPFLGAEMEFHFLFERAVFKAGVSGERVLSASSFSFKSPVEWSFWLKGAF